MQIVEWRERRQNSLRGFATIQMPSGMLMHDVCILHSDRGPWASPPSKPQIQDGRVILEPNGKPKYAPVISFASRELRDKWSAAVIEAMRTAHPEALS